MASSSSQPDEDTVVFNVGGEHFEVLQQMIRSKPDTLLCTMLDDLGRDKTKPIFVNGNAQRFRHILDWYRYGSICLPSSMGIEEMRRECAFFQLPDDVRMKRALSRGFESLFETRDSLHELMQKAAATADEQYKDWSAASNRCRAAESEFVARIMFLCFLLNLHERCDFALEKVTLLPLRKEFIKGSQLNWQSLPGDPQLDLNTKFHSPCRVIERVKALASEHGCTLAFRKAWSGFLLKELTAELVEMKQGDSSNGSEGPVKT
mmetsp:Transcript_26180/g.61070  ORF Transcript_26180/g.61070 Transcript_26180/m.61070 type:complete len:263 (-) Transcript_26180:44-832(-)